MRVLSLFAGIGGMDIGLERAGMTVVAQCEIDPFCRAVLKKHWPDVPQFEDVRKLRGEDVGPVDLVCGGYPCQPFSQAGKRGGAEDDRHLWPEMRRLIEELRPAWVLGENVAGHISLGLDEVLSDLDALGYSARPFVIPACAVSAPHRRDRVWIVAHADSERLQRRVRNLEDVGVKALPTHPTWHEIPANFATHGHDGLPRRVVRSANAVRALGNSVVPALAEQLGRAIMQAEAA